MSLAGELNEEGMTIVFVTHDPRMACFAGRVIHMQDGQVLREEINEVASADEAAA